jgi:hypothetical protein
MAMSSVRRFGLLDSRREFGWASLAIGSIAACAGRETPDNRSPPLVIDRFSARAGHLMVRDHAPALPGPDQPIDLDRPPFVTQGLGPDGSTVRYYNFDVQSDVPGTMYRLVHAGSHDPITGQLDIVDLIPGDDGYSDFWRIAWVEVPANFVPGSITSASQVRELHIDNTSSIVDCPIVPRGTSARGAHGVVAPDARELWRRGQRVTCLHFAPDLVLDGDHVPTSPIYVTFASEAGPPSGFRTEGPTPQTHNVVMSLPGDVDYSPLWAVHVYDRQAFDRVRDANTALAVSPTKEGPLVNCPIIAIGAGPAPLQ